MKGKYWALLVLYYVALFVTSFYFVFDRSGSHLNPVAYEFQFAPEKVRYAVFNTFCCGEHNKLSFFTNGKSGDLTYKNLFSLKDQEYRQSATSKAYYNWWGDLRLNQSYNLKIDSLAADRTRVTIITNSTVDAGWEFYMNHGIPAGLEAKKRDLKASSVEEYELLTRIGKFLTVSDMPEMQLPSDFKTEGLLYFLLLSVLPLALIYLFIRGK